MTKSWVQRLIINGRPTHIGLGPTWLGTRWPAPASRDSRPTHIGLGPTWLVPCAEAREVALHNHRTVRKGGDPRRGAGIPTFAAAVEQVIAMHSAG